MISHLLDLKSSKDISLKKLANPRIHGPGFYEHAIIHPFVYQNHIYFIFGDGSKPIVKFNVKLNNHKTLSKSNIPVTQTLKPKAVRIGHTVWVMGGLAYDWLSPSYAMLADVQNQHNSLTSIWSFLKEKWFRGPNIPKTLDIFENLDHLNLENCCLVTVNSSTVFLISSEDQFTVSYNFLKNSWQRHEKVSLTMFEWPTNCEIYTSKSQEKFIITIFVSWETEKPVAMFIFDIAKNHWTKSFSLTSGLGLVHSFGSLSLINYHQIPGKTQFQYQAIEFKNNEWFWKDPIIREVDFLLDNMSISHFQTFEFSSTNWK